MKRLLPEKTSLLWGQILLPLYLGIFNQLLPFSFIPILLSRFHQQFQKLSPAHMAEWELIQAVEMGRAGFGIRSV